ncbi:MAG: hypothetical protein ACLSVD_13045 [Eggerthellaceae bacterium]
MCRSTRRDGGGGIRHVRRADRAYYGGGFRSADARIDDGLLDVASPIRPSAQRAPLHLPACQGGKHVRFKQIELRRCRTLHLEFDEAPPADGRAHRGTSFDIAVGRRAERARAF